jgi:ElaB/YqjD/DUF883 family membrane-anchored ribosome-binding protein
MTQQRASYPLDYSGGPTGNAHQGTRDTAGNAADQLKTATDNVQEIAGKIAEQAREYVEKAQDAAKNFKPFVEGSLKDQPMTTLAAAAAVGFLLGALWKR